MTTVALRVVPRSAPEPVSWPPTPQPRLSIEPSQPPLPWSADPTSAARIRTATGPGADPRVRTVQFGADTDVDPGLPDPGDWAVRLARMVLETMQGLRPVNQLSRWVEPQILSELTFRSRCGRSERTTLTAVHLHLVSAVAVEAVAVHRSRSGRSGALAFRLDGVPGAHDGGPDRGQDGVGARWICSALSTGPENRPAQTAG